MVFFFVCEYCLHFLYDTAPRGLQIILEYCSIEAQFYCKYIIASDVSLVLFIKLSVVMVKMTECMRFVYA